jgi:ATP-dependent 26S proteasome regulatory subunit
MNLRSFTRPGLRVVEMPVNWVSDEVLAVRIPLLPAPKGIALIGIPGTGKSLTAKMIAGRGDSLPVSAES